MHELLRMQTRADTNRPQCLKEGYRDFGNEVCTEISGTCLFELIFSRLCICVATHGMQHSPLSFDLYSTSRTGNQHVVFFHVSLWTSSESSGTGLT